MTITDLAGADLVAAYLLANAGASKTQSAKLLGIDLSRLGQYRRGDRPVPDHIQRLMRSKILGEVLEAQEASILAGALSPPALRLSRKITT